MTGSFEAKPELEGQRVTSICLEEALILLWTFCRFMISMFTEVEAKVLAELQALQLMPSAERLQPRAMEYDDMARLTYTTNAVKASLYPTLLHCHGRPKTLGDLA